MIYYNTILILYNDTVSDASSSLWDHIFKHSIHIFQWNQTKLWSRGGKGVVDHVLKFRGDPNNITEVTATKASLVWPKCNVKATLVRRPYLAISGNFWNFLLQKCFNTHFSRNLMVSYPKLPLTQKLTHFSCFEMSKIAWNLNFYGC